MAILVVDNYDSFVFNLVQYLGQLGEDDIEVWRNDDPRLAPAEQPTTLPRFAGILLSPGPGTPAAAGFMPEILRFAAARSVPTLGVCLGHQAMGEFFGAMVVRADELLHGKTSPVTHDGTGVLAGLANPFIATRYHSLTIAPETVPPELEVTAHTESGMIMAMRHRTLPLHGVQFHPESVTTEGGHRLLATWLRLCGADIPETLVAGLEAELRAEVVGWAVR